MDKTRHAYEMDIVNAYLRVTGTNIFNTRMLTGRVRVS